MDSPHQPGVERFLAEHKAKVATLTASAYGEAGGHYLLLSEAERRSQAATDAGEFAEALSTRLVDVERIAQIIAAGAGHAVLEDIVRMVAVQERLFVDFVQAVLPDQPDLARELQQRATQLSIRFRMALTAAAMTDVVRRHGLGRDSARNVDPPIAPEG